MYVAYPKDEHFVSKLITWLVYSFIFKLTFVLIDVKTKDFLFNIFVAKQMKKQIGQFWW